MTDETSNPNITNARLRVESFVITGFRSRFPPFHFGTTLKVIHSEQVSWYKKTAMLDFDCIMGGLLTAMKIRARFLAHEEALLDLAILPLSTMPPALSLPPATRLPNPRRQDGPGENRFQFRRCMPPFDLRIVRAQTEENKCPIRRGPIASTARQRRLGSGGRTG